MMITFTKNNNIRCKISDFILYGKEAKSLIGDKNNKNRFDIIIKEMSYICVELHSIEPIFKAIHPEFSDLFDHLLFLHSRNLKS